MMAGGAVVGVWRPQAGRVSDVPGSPRHQGRLLRTQGGLSGASGSGKIQHGHSSVHARPHPCGFLWHILTRDTVTVAVTACRSPRHDEAWGTGGSAHLAVLGLGVRAWCLRSQLPHPGPPLGQPAPGCPSDWTPQGPIWSHICPRAASAPRGWGLGTTALPEKFILGADSCSSCCFKCWWGDWWV